MIMTHLFNTELYPELFCRRCGFVCGINGVPSVDMDKKMDRDAAANVQWFREQVARCIEPLKEGDR